MREMGVFINEIARPELKNLGMDLAQKAGAKLIEPRFPVDIPINLETIVAVCGNGSIKGIMEGIFKAGKKMNLVVVPGGSQNGFYRSVKNDRASLTAEELLDGDVSSLREFSPPQIGGEIFNHGAGFGKGVAMFEELDEKLRSSRIPRDGRSIAAALSASVELFKNNMTDGYLLQLASPGHYFGRFKVFPDQSPFSQDITFAKVKGGTRQEALARMSLITFCMAFGIKIPSWLVETERKERFDFIINDSLSVANIDGRIKHFEIGSQVSMHRVEEPVLVGALV